MKSAGWKILCGGQTGADGAGLEWAIMNGITHGGWCPKGRRSELGPIDAKYHLQETSSSNYLQRTEWNVRDSDGTVIFSLAEHLTSGSLKTLEFAIKQTFLADLERCLKPLGLSFEISDLCVVEQKMGCCLRSLACFVHRPHGVGERVGRSVFL